MREIVSTLPQAILHLHPVLQAEIYQRIQEPACLGHAAGGQGKIIRPCSRDMLIFHHLLCLLRRIARVFRYFIQGSIDFFPLVFGDKTPVIQAQGYRRCPPSVYLVRKGCRHSQDDPRQFTFSFCDTQDLPRCPHFPSPLSARDRCCWNCPALLPQHACP